MSAGEIAGLIAACAFVLLVGVLAVPLLKLGGLLRQAEQLVADVAAQTVPLLGEVTSSVGHVNTELDRVDRITGHVEDISGNVSGLVATVTATTGGPLIRTAALSYGVRRALAEWPRGELGRRVRAELRSSRRRRRE